MPKLAELRKAAVALVGFLAVLVTNGVLHGSAETVAESILSAAVLLGVYAVPNAPKK